MNNTEKKHTIKGVKLIIILIFKYNENNQNTQCTTVETIKKKLFNQIAKKNKKIESNYLLEF